MKKNKNLTISSIINGKSHTGKIALVKSIYEDISIIDGGNFVKHKDILNKKESIIIYNFEKIQNIDFIDFDNTQIIAISSYTNMPKSVRDRFAFIYEMPSLQTRVGEVNEFIEKISQQIQQALDVNITTNIHISKLDLSKNLQSIEASIYKEIIKQTLSKQEIEEILYIYLHSHINEDSSYHELLRIFETPLLKAGLDKYKSTLKLSKVLGINRNTLSKKIVTNAIK